MSIRWKIVGLCLLVTLVPVVFLNHYAVRVFDEFTRKMLEEHMIDFAYIISEEYKASYSKETKDTPYDSAFAERLQRYEKEAGAHMHILDETGKVLYDSSSGSVPDADLSHRPEIAKALTGRYGSRSALTPDRRRMIYYVALPIEADGRIIGIGYVYRDSHAIVRIILRMAEDYRMTLVVSLIISGLASICVAYTMTRRLRRLTQASKKFARGDSPMTAKIQGRDEIGALGRAFSQMAEEISKKGAQNRDLLASTTHELKTPLTAIKGAAQVLADGAADDPDARARFLSNIEFEADRLLGMVEQLSALSQLDAEELRGKKESVDYATFIREAVDRLRPAYTPPNAELRLNLPDDGLRTAIIPGRIEQVLANIVDNAMRYTPKDGFVTISITHENSQLVTSIADTGRGIEPSDLPRVFNQFFSTEPKDTARDYGSGLGLAIARSIVQNHGGRIWAESRPGEGSVFCFSLPLS